MNGPSERTQDYETKHKEIVVNGEPTCVRVVDTVGQERFRMLTSSFFRNAHGVVIAFDLTDRQSFEEAPKHYKSVERYCLTSNVVVMLAGTKADLSGSRKVSSAEARQMAQELGFAGFVETSSSTGYHVDLLFTSITEKIVQVNPGSPPQSSDTIIIEPPSQETSSKSKCC